MVNATLMNIADNPTNVQLPGERRGDPGGGKPVCIQGRAMLALRWAIVPLTHGPPLPAGCRRVQDRGDPPCAHCVHG
jgi:hypothetical protein